MLKASFLLDNYIHDIFNNLKTGLLLFFQIVFNKEEELKNKFFYFFFNTLNSNINLIMLNYQLYYIFPVANIEIILDIRLLLTFIKSSIQYKVDNRLI